MDAERYTHIDEDGDWLARYEPDALSIELLDNGAKHGGADLSAGEVSVPEVQNHAQNRAVLGDQCPICLHTLEDPVMIQGCHHVYCLVCLSSWVRNLVLHGRREPTCPLCKRAFHSAYADVVSETEYEIVHFDGRVSSRNKNILAADSAQRRSMVYAKRMRLMRVNGVDVRNAKTLPPPVKLTSRDFIEWLNRELRACVGPHVDLTILHALIESVIGSPVKRPVDWLALEATLEPFLMDGTTLFTREFAFFLASRLNMAAYDSVIEYCCSGTSETCTIASCTSVNIST
jgi:hypothetical protein